MKRQSIAIIIPYFGRWPEWIDFFFWSCIRNNEIDFFIYSDCQKPSIIGDSINIHYKIVSFDEYCEFISEKLSIDFHPHNPYKLCAVRPFYGYIHKEEIKNYNFWGFGDVDLIFGNIKGFYSDELLAKYDVFSTHSDHVSGHFSILRNTEKYSNICFEIKEWRNILQSQEIHGLDEGALTYVLSPALKYIQYLRRFIRKTTNWKKEFEFYVKIVYLFRRIFRYRRNLYFVEQYTTPYLYDSEIKAKNHATEWIYIDGKIYNEMTGREHIYMHFMSYKKNMFSSSYCWENDFYHLDNEFNNVRIGVNGFDYVKK